MLPNIIKDLVEILSRPRDKTLEFKHDLSSPDGAHRTIVSLANTAGGTLLVGVEDSTATFGVPLTRSTWRSDWPTSSVTGSARASCRRSRSCPAAARTCWRCEVYPSPSRLHHLIREGSVARVYVGDGSTNRRADAELIEELPRFARGEGFDEQPMPGLDSEALDFRGASESFAGPQDSRRRYFLAARGPA
jgi:ATP-dependent DNA helicase RecG